MRLHRLFALALVAFLAACATRTDDVVTVHIFSNQPDHPRVASIVEDLAAAGYRHRITYAKTPGGLEVAETLIVHGDNAGAFNRAQALEDLLAEPGQSIPIQRGGYGNHHFTPGNLGLYIHLPGDEPAPRLKVRAHLAGTCSEMPIELFLFVDHSYRLDRQRWKDEYTLVDAGAESGDWTASGSGYRMTSSKGREWLLEPPLEADPATQVFFIRRHARFEGCRLAEPL